MKIRASLSTVLLVLVGCVHGESQPPKCAASEEPVRTSDVFDHGPDKPEGSTWSCEAACPAGKKRVVSYEDGAPELKTGVFNGRWQRKIEYTCVADCGSGEAMERSPSSVGTGTKYSYSCYNQAEREAKKKAQAAADEERSREDAQKSAEAKAAWKQSHPGAACRQDCAEQARSCSNTCQRKIASLRNRGAKPEEILAAAQAPDCQCQAALDSCVSSCPGAP